MIIFIEGRLATAMTATALVPLSSQTCPQCHGAGYLDDAIECPNCYGHGEVFQLDDVESAE
jgi:DnaJ-class molecular chaperone